MYWTLLCTLNCFFLLYFFFILFKVMKVLLLKKKLLEFLFFFNFFYCALEKLLFMCLWSKVFRDESRMWNKKFFMTFLCFFFISLESSWKVYWFLKFDILSEISDELFSKVPGVLRKIISYYLWIYPKKFSISPKSFLFTKKLSIYQKVPNSPKRQKKTLNSP